MKVYKFGGASIKSAVAIKNIANILLYESSDLMLVISAIDKTTNALEKLLLKYFNHQNFDDEFNFIYNFHFQIINNLFNNNDNFFINFKKITDSLYKYLCTKSSDNFDKEYDTIVSFGEIMSTHIISAYLNKINIKNKWIDARKIIKTNSNFRAADIDFNATIKRIKENIDFKEHKIFITQGFIGSDNKQITTTLGREGSDYTASVIANLLNAKNLTLWKDVAGIFNADPKLKTSATKIEKISYREATELAYFGAKIIHQKTAKPLIDKNIPLTIRSFNNLNETGTTVSNFNYKIFPIVPIYIFNKNQTLITISSNNFVNEYLFEKVFSTFRKFKTKINLFQNSALNLSLCFDYNPNNFENLLIKLKENFKVRYNSGLTLLTIRHYNEETIKKCTLNKKILLEQKNRVNAFFLIEE